MMKKNKLYTVNRFNRPLFISEENVFDWGGLAKGAYSGRTPWLKLSPEQQANEIENYKNSINAFGISKADNPFSKGNIQGGLKSMVSTPIGGTLISGAAGVIGGLANSAISGDLESGAGSAISNIGGQLGSAVGAVNPIAGVVVGAGSQILGGLTNRMFGSKLNQEKIAEVNADNARINQNANLIAGSNTTDDLMKNSSNIYMGQNFTQSDIGEDGWFSSKASDEYERLKAQQETAQEAMKNSIVYAQNNVDNADDARIASNFIMAHGGLLNGNKKGNRMNRMTQMPIFMNNFALGGILQTHGSDWGDGLIAINAGGSHEENPNDGVQMGVDNEGTPNLVEEGETVWNDYVFSNRILADDATKQMFKLPKKKDVTFADISKKLEKEIAERPNDPISRLGFEAQMQTLEEQQERQKSEMEAERARAAFEALSPEEQTAVMQNAAQQEAMAQQAAQEQAIAEQQAMQQPSPEEVAMVQQQADGTEAALGQPAPEMAEGGKLFKKGGPTKKNAGTWKKGTSKENWDKYSRNGLRDFLLKVNDDIANADTEEKKNKIREDAIKTVRGIQQAYSEAYQNNLTPSEVNEKVRALQKAFQDAGGNAYFGDIADNINLPKGHNTTDTEEKGWIDGLWGPRTSIRNWGSTEYGDDYDDIRELAQEAGLTYAPGQYKYGDNTLYELGMAQPDVAATPAGRVFHTVEGEDDYLEGEPNTWVGVGPEVRRETLDNGDTVIYHNRQGATAQPGVEAIKETEDNINKVPIHRPEWLRYAGLFGPAVGLGMQMAGVGRPDYGRLDTAVESIGNAHLADYKPLGNYLAYRPMDIWFEQNRMDANARATDRAIMNSTSPSRMAGLLASGYNNQIANGDLYRKALEYNDAKRERVASFNRGTDQFNAEAYNRNSQFNADALNRNRQYRAGLAMQAARDRMAGDASWYNGIYGNVAGLFKGIGDLGTENYRMNRISEMAADGVFGNLGDSYTGRKNVRSAAKGGKLNKKKKGLTF